MKAPRRLPRRQTIKEEFTNLPNLITLARIAAIPAVLYFIDPNSREYCFYAAVIFIAAAISDAIDGYIARRRGLHTVVGKFMDPLADKLLVMAVLIYMVRIDWVPDWLAVVLIGREIAITSLRAIAGSEGLVIAASAFGKTKTVFQLIGISGLILHFPFTLPLVGFSVDPHVVGLVFLYVSVFLSIFSFVQYTLFFFEAAEASALARREGDGEGDPGEGAAEDDPG